MVERRSKHMRGVVVVSRGDGVDGGWNEMVMRFRHGGISDKPLTCTVHASHKSRGLSLGSQLLKVEARAPGPVKPPSRPVTARLAVAQL